MRLAFWLVTTTIKSLTQILCRIDAGALERVPKKGPLILVANHVNFLEAPVMYTQLLPRPVTGFVKAQTYDNPFLGALFTLWGGIPLQRDEVDRSALREGLRALERGWILAIAPEGTRSGSGRLAQGHPGVVTMAVQSGAPLLPVAYYGGERIHQNYRRLRRTDFHVRVGRVFQVDTQGKRLTREQRLAITDEIMYQLAGLLPAEYRGVYTNLDVATTEHLRFLSPSGDPLAAPYRA